MTFLSCDLETVALSMNFEEKLFDSNKPIYLFNSLTLYEGKDCLELVKFVKPLKIEYEKLIFSTNSHLS